MHAIEWNAGRQCWCLLTQERILQAEESVVLCGCHFAGDASDGGLYAEGFAMLLLDVAWEEVHRKAGQVDGGGPAAAAIGFCLLAEALGKFPQGGQQPGQGLRAPCQQQTLFQH